MSECIVAEKSILGTCNMQNIIKYHSDKENNYLIQIHDIKFQPIKHMASPIYRHKKTFNLLQAAHFTFNYEGEEQGSNCYVVETNKGSIDVL